MAAAGGSDEHAGRDPQLAGKDGRTQVPPAREEKVPVPSWPRGPGRRGEARQIDECGPADAGSASEPTRAAELSAPLELLGLAEPTEAELWGLAPDPDSDPVEGPEAAVPSEFLVERLAQEAARQRWVPPELLLAFPASVVSRDSDPAGIGSGGPGSAGPGSAGPGSAGPGPQARGPQARGPQARGSPAAACLMSWSLERCSRVSRRTRVRPGLASFLMMNLSAWCARSGG